MEPQTTDTLPRPRLILTIGNSHIVSPDLDSGVRPVSKFSDDDVSPSTPADDECMSAFDKEGEDEISALSSPTPSNHSHPSSTSATDNLNTTYPQPSDRQVGRPLRNAAAMARARVSSSVQLKRPSPYLKNERSTPVLKTQSRTRARKRDTSAGTPALESMRRRPVDPIGQMIFLQGPVPVMPTVQELKTEGKGTWMSSCERAWRALEGTKGLGLKDGAWKACMAYDENGEAHQPNLTFDLKLRLAIASSPRKKLTLSQIRQVFLERWPYFKGDSKWERTIRHVLTTTHHFCKVPGEEGENIRGNYWTVCTHIPLCKKPDKHVKPFVEFSASSNIPSHAANGTGKMEDLSSDPSSSFALPHPQPGDRMKLETFSSGRKDTPGPSNLLSTPRPASSGERSPNDPCRNTKEWPPSTFTPRSPPGKSWHPQSAFSRSAYRMSYPPPTHHQPRQQSSMATISTLRPPMRPRGVGLTEGTRFDTINISHRFDG
ncbi:hypothetical protein M231_03797 [Tremella mesenterica]|uniref:Fork-head domain-containing protein n=1 Tax=Tremella mesenterica TaxID=5217 RepID=A0A4Q1BMR1_TREME|nr:hypothetical protein M231_03797 [Tremella mesenterica]